MSRALRAFTQAPQRTERDEERDCDAFVRMIGGKEAVVERSPPHRFMGTKGIPDRRYRLFDVAFDFEVKKPAGVLSDEQIAYLRAERQCGNLAACGTLQDLQQCVEWLREARRNDRTYRELVELFGGIVEAWVQNREAERKAVADRKLMRLQVRQQRELEKQQRAAAREAKRRAKRARPPQEPSDG